MPPFVIAAKSVQYILLGYEVILLPVLTYAQIINFFRDDAYLRVMLGPVKTVTM